MFRELVVLRKIIGTLRNDRGMFVHEMLLSLWLHVVSRDATLNKLKRVSPETTRWSHENRLCP